MDLDDLEDWKICWQANLRFYKPVTQQQKCIVCSKITAYAKNTRRSAFWLDSTRCLAGHRQATEIETKSTPSLGVCATCDQMYMFDLLRGKHTCRREGCRRNVRIHEVQALEKLESNNILRENFVSLLLKYRTYECIIHCDEVAYDTGPLSALKPPTRECDHDRNVCDECLKAAYESAIRGGRLQDLVCLDSECRKTLPLETIRSNISGDVFKIYNKQLALKTISKDPNFRWCPCGHGQIHGPGETNPEWLCLSCSRRHCYICKEDSSLPCEHLQAIDAKRDVENKNKKETAGRVLADSLKQAEKTARILRDDEAGTKREIARTTKKCPKKGCCNKIERNSGCGHFTCKMCSTDFCWSCKVIWEEGTARHLVGCKIGTRSQVRKGALDLSAYAAGWDVDQGYDLRLDEGLWLIGAHL